MIKIQMETGDKLLIQTPNGNIRVAVEVEKDILEQPWMPTNEQSKFPRTFVQTSTNHAGYPEEHRPDGRPRTAHTRNQIVAGFEEGPANTNTIHVAEYSFGYTPEEVAAIIAFYVEDHDRWTKTQEGRDPEGADDA